MKAEYDFSQGKRGAVVKKLPELKTDNDAADFIDTADLTEYDLSALVPISFKHSPESRTFGDVV